MPNADAARRRKVKNATSDRLWWASRTGNEREVEKILPRVASTEWKDPKNGWTALHAAVCNDTDPQDRTTAMLLRGGANPNVTDENGVTPLQCACATLVAAIVIPLQVGKSFFGINADVADLVNEYQEELQETATNLAGAAECTPAAPES